MNPVIGNITDKILAIKVFNIPLSVILEYLRIGIIVFDVLLVIATVMLFFKALKMRPRFKANPDVKPVLTIRREDLLAKWSDIQEKLADGRPDSLKIAVIQGDALVDSILKGAGIEGEHMADRLDNVEPGEFQSLEDVWRSHKIRNQVVHEENYELTSAIAERALRGYEKFLREIKVLT